MFLSRGLVETEAEQLLQAAYRHTLGQPLSRIQLFSRMSDPFPERAWNHLVDLSQQRAQGKILQHIIGYQEFFTHEYEVTPAVLVPRPETEILVENAIFELSAGGASPSLGLEIGLGSGIISLELLSRFPGLRMIASELSPHARACALKNANRILGSGIESSTGKNDLQKDRLTILTATHPLDVFLPFRLDFQADFLISNPPYLISEDLIESDVLDQEPHEALFAPESDPLYFYRVIANEAMKYLMPGGFVFAELPHERACLMSELFETRGWDVRIQKDLTGRDRVLIAKLR